MAPCHLSTRGNQGNEAMEAGIKCLCRDTSCVSEASIQGETKSKYLPFLSCLFYHRTHWKLGLGESVELVFEVQLAEHRAGCILVRIVPEGESRE